MLDTQHISNVTTTLLKCLAEQAHDTFPTVQINYPPINDEIKHLNYAILARMYLALKFKINVEAVYINTPYDVYLLHVICDNGLDDPWVEDYLWEPSQARYITNASIRSPDPIYHFVRSMLMRANYTK